MEAREVARVLGAAAAFDNRKVDDVALIGWGRALGENVTLEDALAAVVEHYASTTDWLMPAHVNQRAKAMRAKRTATVVVPPPPPAVDPSDVERGIAYQRAFLRAIGDGLTADVADAVACRAVGAPVRVVEQLHARPFMALLEQASRGSRIPVPG